MTDSRRITALHEVDEERSAQVVKWGTEENLLSGHGNYLWYYLLDKLAILTEEVGEAAKGCNEHDWENVRTELIQVAAVAVAMVEGLDYAKEVGIDL